ncbi:MAG: hypothetical protein FWD58_08145 [Firmicutes bacterium]|nr:hypothetical protein [Bacillota bacterium]
MKLVSEQLINGKRFAANARLDTVFIRDTRIDDGIILFDYYITEIQTRFPFVICGILFIAKLSSTNLYLSCVLSLDTEDETILSYAADGYLEYKIELSAAEEKELLLFLVRFFMPPSN